MRRCIFTFVGAVSLLLCVATLVMWVRSYWVSDEIYLPIYFHDDDERTYDTQLTIAFGMGRIGLDKLVQSSTSKSYRQDISSIPHRLYRTHPPNYPFALSDWSPPHSAGGFAWGRYSFRRIHSTRPELYGFRLVVPLWPLLLVTLPIAWVGYRCGRGRELSRGRCPACFYDLTGNTSGVCPECGTAIQAS